MVRNLFCTVLALSFALPLVSGLTKAASTPVADTNNGSEQQSSRECNSSLQQVCVYSTLEAWQHAVPARYQKHSQNTGVEQRTWELCRNSMSAAATKQSEPSVDGAQ